MDPGVPGVEFETHGRIASAVARKTGIRAPFTENRPICHLTTAFALAAGLKSDRLLERLNSLHGAPLPEKMAAFGIAGGGASGLKKLFMTHPPLEERIAALKAQR